MNKKINDIENEIKQADFEMKQSEVKAAIEPIIEKTFEVAGQVYQSLPETPKTIAESVAAGALIGNFIPIPGVGAGIGALVGGAVGWWRIKNK